jgi:2',3'-cyclic-nucleotide 2'-phosphodiesterase (5'-nucleotidase family)
VTHHRPFQLIRRVIVASILVAATTLLASERAHITVLVTTDLHGHIYPVDYFTQKPSNDGLAKIATLVKQARARQPNLLLVDCGDVIQGTPLVYHHNRKNNTPTDPMMVVMNSLDYTSLTPGNHEYNFGLDILGKARREANFPWISANTYKAGTNETFFTPYVIKELAGVRVAILGLTTPTIPLWENPEHFAGLEFRETVSEAKKWVRHLREQERVDVVIGTFHMGLEEVLSTGAPDPGTMPTENACLTIAREVPGIDFIFMGHSHRVIPSLNVNGAILAQAGRWGNHLVRADLYLSREPGQAWRIEAKSSEAIPVTDKTAADPEVLKLAQSYHEETEAWLNRVIGHSAREISAAEGSFSDNALLDLIHRVQLHAGQADVSLAANFNPRARIPAGPVTVRDIASLYIYENTLYVIEVTGAQLKAALEHSARYFVPYESGKAPRDLVDSTIPGYNFDIAEGVGYEIDLRSPIGQRIKNLTFKGQPLLPDQKLKLATNNYRFNGGGGYSMFKDAPVLVRGSEEIRDLIINWVEQNGTIPAEPTNNWRLLP